MIGFRLQHAIAPMPATIFRYASALAGLIAVFLTWPGVAQAQVIDRDSLIRLPIRFHLLRSPESQAVTTTWTDVDVQDLLRSANAVWKQARIEWVLESIVEENAPNGALFDSILAGRVPRTPDRQQSIVPRGLLFKDGWNVFLIRDYGQIAGGVFWPEIPAIVLAQRGMGFELAAGGRGGSTLAHELGHSLLGLDHVECTAERNIMAIACSQPGRPSTLTVDQIRRARRQAMTGQPITERRVSDGQREVWMMKQHRRQGGMPEPVALLSK